MTQHAKRGKMASTADARVMPPPHLTPTTAPTGTRVCLLTPDGDPGDDREYEVRAWVSYGREDYARVMPTRPTLAESDGRLYEVAGWRSALHPGRKRDWWRRNAIAQSDRRYAKRHPPAERSA